MGVPPPTPISLAQVHDLIDRSAEQLGWTDKYVNLLSTTATGIFVAAGEPDTLPIDLETAEGQIETIRSSLRERGKSAKTGDTYAAAWRRIAAIVDGWQQACADGEEKQFWSTFADNYRDPRLARRRIRRVRPATDTASVVTNLALPTTVLADETSTYELRLDNGVAQLVLPNELSDDDIGTIVVAVSRHRFKTIQ